jgi:hypothetical protein
LTNPFLIIEQEEPFAPSKGWAEMIRKVYEVGPLLCPSCGGKMSIISSIEDHKVIDKIIDHLTAAAENQILMFKKLIGAYNIVEVFD